MGRFGTFWERRTAGKGIWRKGVCAGSWPRHQPSTGLASTVSEPPNKPGAEGRDLSRQANHRRRNPIIGPASCREPQYYTVRMLCSCAASGKAKPGPFLMFSFRGVDLVTSVIFFLAGTGPSSCQEPPTQKTVRLAWPTTSCRRHRPRARSICTDRGCQACRCSNLSSP